MRSLIPFSKIKGLRNLISHSYDEVDPKRLWITVQSNVSPLIDDLSEYLSKNINFEDRGRDLEGNNDFTIHGQIVGGQSPMRYLIKYAAARGNVAARKLETMINSISEHLKTEDDGHERGDPRSPNGLGL